MQLAQTQWCALVEFCMADPACRIGGGLQLQLCLELIPCAAAVPVLLWCNDCLIASDGGQKHGRVRKQFHCLQWHILLFHALIGSLLRLEELCKPNMLRAHCISADGSA
jgi:hypothetical protein